MASNYTTNYQLNQWEPADAVQRVKFNQDNAKVDAALKSLSDQVVQKANQSALNTVISAVNQKADASTVSDLSQTVAAKADQSALTAEASARTEADAVIQAAALRLEAGSYIGDGKYGSTGARTLDFSASLGRPPKVVFFMGSDSDRHPALLCQGMEDGFGGSTMIWSGNTLTWYGDTPGIMMNREGNTYYYFAIG